MGVTSKSVRLPVQKVQHWTGGGHQPMVLVRLLWQRLVPMCPGVILDRASSKAVLRTRGAGTSAHQAGTSLNMALAVGKPGLSARVRNWGFRKAVDHLRRERRCGQSLVRWTEEPRAVRLLKGASDVKRAVRLAQRVASSIRSRGGIRANEHGESSRRERLGCPAHP